MRVKPSQFIPVFLAFAFVGFGYFSGWCANPGHVCFRTVIDRMIPEVTYPLFFFASFFIPAALVLAFVSQSVFSSWLKFAVWALPLLAIFVALTPVNFTGIGMDFFPFYRDDAARLAGEVFAGASIILIGWKYFVNRRTTYPQASGKV